MSAAATCAALLLATALTGCNDIVDFNDGYTPADKLANSGAPTISAVYAVADTALTTPITQAEAGEMVRIVGTNLNNVKSVTFNTVPVEEGDIYTYATSANVRIPQAISFEQVNKIEYVTDKGTATFDFVVPFPTLTVDAIDNEFANAGDSVTFTGANFDMYQFGTVSHVLVNGVEAGTGSITKKQMKALIPAGTPDNSTISVQWQTSDGQAMQRNFAFRPTRPLLFGGFDGVQMNVDGSIAVAVEDDDATSAQAKLGLGHLHITGDFGAWAWNTIDLSCNMVDGGEDLSDLSQCVLRFEVLTTKSHTLTEDSPLQFSFNWGDSYTWTPGNGSGLNTFGEWQTVELPLAPMATNGIKEPGTWQTLRIVFQPHAAYTADFCLGNFRIVKK